MADSHLHSTAMSAKGLNVPAIYRSLAATGAGAMVDVAITPHDLAARQALMSVYPLVAFSSGVHPAESGSEQATTWLEDVEQQIRAGAVQAVGETGLDWVRDYAPRERQQELFEGHIALAKQSGLPIIVHNRGAEASCLTALKRAGVHGVMHCFSAGASWVRPFLDCGMFISFAGNITYRSATDLREALRTVPLDRLLLETDAPYLTPAPNRGQLNHSGFIEHTYRAAATILDVPVEELAVVVDRNTRALFALPAAGTSG